MKASPNTSSFDVKTAKEPWKRRGEKCNELLLFGINEELYL
jgi:hypothetical protein